MTSQILTTNQSGNKHHSTPAESPILTQLRHRKAVSREHVRRLVRAARLGLPICERCEIRPVEQEIVCFEAKERFSGCTDCISHQAAEYQRNGWDFETRDIEDGFRLADGESCPECHGSGCSYCHKTGQMTKQLRSMLSGDNPPKEMASNE